MRDLGPVLEDALERAGYRVVPLDPNSLLGKARAKHKNGGNVIALPDVRYQRARAVAGVVMAVLFEYLERTKRLARNEKSALADIIVEGLHDAGVDWVTDELRKDAGLSPRGPLGWTKEELAVLDDYRTEVMRRPIQVLVPRA